MKQSEDMVTDFTTILNNIKNGINSDVYIIKERPIYKVYVEDHEETDNPTFAIYRGSTHIANIYDLSDKCENEKNSQISEAHRNAKLYDNPPFYLFFFEGGTWRGLHLFSCQKRKSSANRFNFDVFSKFTDNTLDNLWDTTTRDVILRLKTCDEIGIKRQIVIDIQSKIKKWLKSKKEVSFGNRVLQLVERWQYLPLSSLIEIHESKFALVPREEDNLFLAILGTCTDKHLYRYVQNSTLKYIMCNGTHAMSSIVCMNDSTECFYAYEYVMGKKTNENRQLDYYFSYDEFITSLSLCKPEELTMWRLYGDEAKGLAIEYDIEGLKLPDGFYLAPVSYPQDNGCHVELDFVKCILNESFDNHKLRLSRWNVWQRFFKPYGFKVEKEVRLLYHHEGDSKSTQSIEWVFANGVYSPIYKFSLINKVYAQYPLPVTKIVLGSRFLAPEVNEVLIKERLHEQELDVDVETSKIDYYRINEL